MDRRSRRLLAAGLGIVAALALGEVVVRLAVPRYAPREPTYEIEQRDGSWVYRPGSRVEFAWDGDPFGTLPEGARQEIAINSEGLRGPLPDPWRPAVVVLGDSFTFGEGVADDATIPALLEDALRDASTPPPACVNAGVSAHGTREEALRLPGLLARFRPRAVVLVHVPNDAIPWHELKTRDRANLLEPPGGGALRVLGLIRAATTRGDLEEWYRSFYLGEKREWGDDAREALDAMASLCREQGVRLGVVAHPFLHRLDGDPLRDVTDVVRTDCERLDVPFLDLLPAFEGQVARDLWVHPTDRHPNARANALSVSRMAPFVRDLLR